MQVIGFCRFSYPAEGGFQVEHQTIEDRISYLYSKARIEERFQHFEAICLPGLKAQTDPDFTFLILVGDQLPASYRQRLEALISDFPQARITALPPLRHRDACKQAINELRDLSEPCLQFRHDDDDAVAVDFVAELKQAAEDCVPLLAKHRLVGFDWNRGYVARPDRQGIFGEETVTPYWGVAQGMFVQAGERLTIMNFAHNKIDRFMPTVTFTDSLMYVRGHNDHNDSRQKPNMKPDRMPLLDPQGEALMRERFAIDADQVRRIFA